MRVHQAMFGAGVAAMLVLGADAGPVGRASAISATQLYSRAIVTVCDLVLASALDAVGEVKAHVGRF